MNATLRASVAAVGILAVGAIAVSANVIARTGNNRITHPKTSQQLGQYVPNTPRPSLNVPTKPQPSSPSCANWTVLNQFRAKYGDLTYCGLSGNEWVVAMYGKYDTTTKTHGAGGLAVYQCSPSDSACLDPNSPHPASGWKVYAPPYAGSVSVLSGDSKALVVDNAGHQMCFSLTSLTYAGACAAD